ncbi:MAG: gluconokinase [Thermomicrobiales bacterium]|nr:gluconokinase [Thermomicrobiales bacterium]
MTRALGTEPVVLSVDIGSSSVRAMLFDRRARAIDAITTQIPYELEITPDGGATLDPALLLSLVEACIDESVERIGDRFGVAAVGISSFWHSLLGLNAEGHPVTPMLHLADSRSASIVDRLRESEDEAACRAIAGTVFHSSYWPGKLRWLREAQPESFGQITTWSSGADYLFERLTGERAMSVCMASGTGMLDVSRCEWSPELADVAGIAIETLPRLVDRSEPARLTANYAQRWPALAEAAWFAPLGDGACANVGSNACATDRIALTLGTTGAMRVLVESQAGRPIEPVPGVWTYRLDRSAILRGAAITNGGIWIDFLRDLLGDADADLLDEAFGFEPASHGLTVLPFLAGERAPIWNDRARAVIAGLHPGTTPAAVVRAGLESVAHRLRAIYDLVAPVAGADHAIVANGAALLKSPGWQQIVASDLEHPIVTLPEDLEASARGAAMCALVDAGLIGSFDDVDDLAEESPSVAPDPVEVAAYAQERLRHHLLEKLLYPGTESWDQG